MADCRPTAAPIMAATAFRDIRLHTFTGTHWHAQGFIETHRDKERERDEVCVPMYV
jgi:hypothetical protein